MVPRPLQRLLFGALTGPLLWSCNDVLGFREGKPFPPLGDASIDGSAASDSSTNGIGIDVVGPDALDASSEKPNESALDGGGDGDADGRRGCADVDGGLPSVPVLDGPSIGTYTGTVWAEASLRPAFHWRTAANGACGVPKYEIQVDDSCPIAGYATCAFPSPEVAVSDIADTVWTTDKSLVVSVTPPVGRRYFWRVRACDAPSHCSAWSQVRYLNVGRLRDDLNGDGYSELTCFLTQVMSSNMTVAIKAGAKMPFPPSDMGVQYQSDQGYDTPPDQLRFLGDVNGDGFADLVAPWGPAAVHVLLGGSDLAQLQQISFGFVDASPGSRLGSGDDWNGDGYSDVIVGRPSASGAKAYVYYGGPDFSSKRREDAVILPPISIAGAFFGEAVSSLGDLNGDGYPDFGILAPADKRLYMLRGASSPEVAPTAFAAADASCFDAVQNKPSSPITLLSAGNLDGDGVADAGLTCGTQVFAYFGGRDFPTSWGWTSRGNSPVGDVVAGWDLGSDGFHDLLFTRRVDGANPVHFAAETFAGGPTLASQASELPFIGVVSDPLYGSAPDLESLSIGDHNGDGRADIVAQVTSLMPIDARYTGYLRWLPGPAPAGQLAISDWGQSQAITIAFGRQVSRSLAR